MRHVLYILILMVLMGCDGVEKPDKPANLIPEEKMSEIMYDLYILNAAKGVNRKLLERNGIMPADYVYKKHGIDSLQFAQSNTYYAYDMKAYNRIMDKMKDALEKDKAFYEKLVEEDEKDDVKKIETPQKEKNSVILIDFELED